MDGGSRVWASILVPLSELTLEDTARRAEYNAARSLWARYTDAQLEDWLTVDLYAALDLDSFRFREVPRAVLRHAVKRKSIEYHPTRNGGRTAAFVLVQRAGEILGNARYKAVYDSHIFDETVPADREYALNEFLAVFGPVFAANGVYSEQQPVPPLAGSVDVFYKFWNAFRTTRVYDDPADIIDQSGAGRRYNVEQNRERTAKRRLADLQRIRALVTLAYQRDPRIHRATRASAPWTAAELASLKKFALIFARSKNIYADIANKLTAIYATRRTPEDVRRQLQLLKSAPQK